MTPEQFRAALERLGLNYRTAAVALRMGKWGFQTVGKWARGEKPIPARIQVIIELMLEQAEFVKIERME